MKQQYQFVRNWNKFDYWIFVLGISYMSFSTFIDMLFTMLIGQNPFDTLLYLGVMCFLTLMSLKANRFKVKINVFYVPLVFVLFFSKAKKLLICGIQIGLVFKRQKNKTNAAFIS